MHFHKASLWLILLIAAMLLFLRLGSISVFQVAEARNAACASEMYQQRNWIIPEFNGALRTDKPALEYFAMIAAYYLFGVTEGSARFFSAVCGVLVILFTFLFARKHFGQPVAVWSSLALLASIHTILQFRLATPDPYLILFHVGSLFSFWEGWISGKWKWYALMYISLGLAFLAKGPIGLFLPAVSIFLFLLVTKQLSWPVIRQLKPWYGVFLLLLFCLPWYLLVHYKTHGAWTNGFFLQHNIGRFKGAMDGHRGSFLLPSVFVLLGMFPFSVFSFRAAGKAWRERKRNSNLLFLLICFFTVLAFYSFSQTKLINYTTPSYPFLAILVGSWIASLRSEYRMAAIKPELAFIFLLSIALPIGIYLYSSNTDPLREVSWIAFFFMILPCIIATTLLFKEKSIRHTLYLISGAYMFTSLLFFLIAFPVVDNQTAFKKRQNILKEHSTVIAYKNFNDAFVFYVHHPISIFQDKAQLDTFLDHRHNVLVLYKGKDLSDLNNRADFQTISKDKDLFSSSYSVIYHKN